MRKLFSITRVYMRYHRYKKKPGGYWRGRSRTGRYYTKQGCYIATCVYGSYDSPEVCTLRRFRDYKLKRTVKGRAFIFFYYLISPKLVLLIGHRNWFRKLAKKHLDSFVASLQKQGYSSDKYNGL